MISILLGRVNSKFPQGIEVLTGAIGFQVLVPLPFLTSLSEGEEVRLYTKLIVGEKLLDLYGFERREDCRIFEMLTSVSGVGPKTALQIFNEKEGEEIREAIDRADVPFFASIKGIGPKTAQRIIVDLRSVLDREKLMEEKRRRQEAGLVYEALIQLGFSKQEVEKAISRLPKEGSDEEKISQALNLLAKEHGK